MSDFSKELKKIENMLWGIVQGIKSVIDVDVTIIDANRNRLAGTGAYQNQIGEKVDMDSVFSYALKRGQAFVIDNPREHEACYYCQHKTGCSEFAQMCSPIKIKGAVAGVIGLIAFDKEKKQNLLEQKKALMGFLEQMANLIAAKIQEERQTEVLQTQSKALEVILDSMENAVFSFDKNFVVSHSNARAKKMLCALKGERASLIEKAFSEIERQTFFQKKNLCQGQIEIEYRGKKIRMIYNSHPVVCKGEVREVVLTCTPLESLIQVYHKVTSSARQVIFEDIIGISKGLTNTIEMAQRAAKSISTVLIQGESGTGKELFARAIHGESPRHSNPFIAINCAAIPDNLLESELFGYEEGAFTGARTGGKIGKFEMAHRGTLFLDEIGDMSLHLQAKILRVLQERELERVGGQKSFPVDVRILAATNQNLEKRVKEKAFREDLYYRLNVIPLFIPSLRERKEDLLLLTNFFLRKSAEKLKKPIFSLTKEVEQVIKKYVWPGNVRELENVIEFAVNMCETKELTLENLPPKIQKTFDEMLPCHYEVQPLALLEKKAILDALHHFENEKNNLEKTAVALGISRATLYRKIKQFGHKSL